MSNLNKLKPNPELDLMFERVIDVPPELIWAPWTTPEKLKPWFCPLPWKTIDCEIDLRPGGIFHTVMQSPEGQTFPIKHEKMGFHEGWGTALDQLVAMIKKM